MKRFYRYQLIIVLCLSSLGFKDSLTWDKQWAPFTDKGISAMVFDDQASGQAYIASENTLYRFMSDNVYSEEPLLNTGISKRINEIFIPFAETSQIYVATNDGLYLSPDDGRIWNRIFISSDKNEAKVNAVWANTKRIFVGTGAGLFTAEMGQDSWQNLKAVGLEGEIAHIGSYRDHLYVSSGTKVFVLNKDDLALRLIFSMGLNSFENNEAEYFSEENTKEKSSIRDIQVSSEGTLFVGTTGGIFYRESAEGKWERMSSENLPIKDLEAIVLLSPEQMAPGCEKTSGNCQGIIAGTLRGAFITQGGRWKPLYRGMEATKVTVLATDAGNSVWAATDKGLYKMPLSERLLSLSYFEQRADISSGELESPFKGEPNINEVHRFAIDYAEVNPEKIARWRTLASKKALLPDLSVGVDRNATDLFHWNTGANPDELQKGRAYFEWDVSLSWDLSDYIWSTDQTTIDSRSKLMVELREDVLDEVTRLYFERRRLQVEMFSLAKAGETQDWEKELRVAELTALLDAMTGGEFSRGMLEQNRR